MSGVTERYPSRVQSTATTSPTTAESDVTLRFSHERLGHVPYRCPIWLMLNLFLVKRWTNIHALQPIHPPPIRT